jgi:hypothetical protein
MVRLAGRTRNAVDRERIVAVGFRACLREPWYSGDAVQGAAPGGHGEAGEIGASR